MRTQDEIAVRYKERTLDDIFGFAGDVLLRYLDADHARPFYKDGADLSALPLAPLTEGAVLEEVRSYLDFAYEKARDQRGLSAMRSIIKLECWVWVMGRDDVLALMEASPYAPYGLPKLDVVRAMLGQPAPMEV